MRALFLLILITLQLFASEIWHKNNLYDKITLSYYIPHELWLGISWDGNKEQKFTAVKSQKIEGVFNWYHPYLKKHLKVYKKTVNNKNELYTLYPKGIAKVYSQKNSEYLNNGLSFPAGFGWKIGKVYNFSQESWIRDRHQLTVIGIEITKINFIDDFFDNLTYNYYINGKLYDTYTYKKQQEYNE